MQTTEHNGHIFDWKPSTNGESNARHRLQGLDCYSSGSRLRKIKRSMPLNLDQGREGACTGFGCAHALAASPKAHRDITVKVALSLYHQARREDEWEGENYDGSSVNGAMKAARTLGRIKAWRWARTPGELQHGLSYHGAAEAGSLWLANMIDVDSDGYLRVSGSVVGGHAYAISGYREAPDRGPTSVDYWIDNSWGPDWGIYGGGWIRDVDAHKLWFASQGEVAFPIK